MWEAPDGLIAQFVEHCIDIAKVIGLNPVQAWIFFQALISQLLNACPSFFVNWNDGRSCIGWGNVVYDLTRDSLPTYFTKSVTESKWKQE